MKKVEDVTVFNTDIAKQFVPYWNGLLHVVARVDPDTDGILIRRYDWDAMREECQQFQSDYLQSQDFCDHCAFSQIPAWLENQMAGSTWIWDCKTIAQDNDILYTYCVQKQYRFYLLLITGLFFLLFAWISWNYYRKKKMMKTGIRQETASFWRR